MESIDNPRFGSLCEPDCASRGSRLPLADQAKRGHRAARDRRPPERGRERSTERNLERIPESADGLAVGGRLADGSRRPGDAAESAYDETDDAENRPSHTPHGIGDFTEGRRFQGQPVTPRGQGRRLTAAK